MHRSLERLLPLCLSLCFLIADSASATAAERPNIVVILTDDQGFADISFNRHHPEEVSTPHMDALAKEGVFFTQAYISGNVCSPTRAGLMLGQYQQRVGVYTAGEGGRGFDPTIPVFPSFLPEEYATMVIGKWHLGLDEDYPELKWHALSRGFDEFYGFMGRGAHDYFQLRQEEGSHPIYRNRKRIDDEGYLTTRLTEEAVAFIDRNQSQPFFLYLAYNAVHAPPQAPEETIAKYLRKFPELSEERQVLMAMLEHLDEGVGRVVGKLKEERFFDNTLLFFLTDNGGAKRMHADNAPLRGFKGTNYEGGIRTPFIVSWPARFDGGRTIDTPVISLDILPTALDAVDGESDREFDGKSLLPLLTGETSEHHDVLYWSEAGGDWAVRKGDWKLHAIQGQLQLVDLAADPAEERNLAEQDPERVRELKSLYDRWIEEMAEPLSGRSKVLESGSATPLTPREQKRLERRKERRKQRQLEKKAQVNPNR